MKNFIDASIAVTQFLSKLDVEISSVKILPKNVGWVFFYKSNKVLESQNPLDGLAGNAPIIYDRITSQLHETRTAHPVDYYVSEYLKNNNYI